ncbi:MAG TPA: hypothetical protein VFO16_03555 [Pseudonocardiaceae bacterium]|nr:hypothetical protein [Pseudonocardiaceae bacterium]
MRYALNGLNVACEIHVNHARLAPAHAPPDVVIRYGGQRPVPATVAEGTLLQRLACAQTLLQSTVRQEDGRVLQRLHGLVDFEIARDRRDVCAWTDLRCDLEILGILVAGHLLATVLALRGETVLHASAVEVDGAAIAFVAESGVGKSTLAALACARGARFVTDDVLRLYAAEDGTIRCWAGATENRLRREVADLPGNLPGAATRTSADGRVVWSPPATTSDTCRLSTIVLPQPNRERRELELRRIAPGTAVLELSRRPRLLGWSDERIIGETFINLSRFARTVPVYLARVPWGPPFDEAVIDTLLTRCLSPRSTRRLAS